MALPYCMVCQTHHGYLDQLCPALNPRGDTMRNNHAVSIERNETSKRMLSIEDDDVNRNPYVKIVRKDGELTSLYVKEMSFSETSDYGKAGPDAERDAKRLRDRAHLLMRAADLVEDINA